MSTETERTDAIAAQVHALDETLRAMDEPTPPMRVIYIAGPYRAATQYQVERNIRKAEAMMLLVCELGMAALCPHTMTRYCDGIFSDDYWLNATLELMRRCDAVVCCNGWESSTGTLGEVAEAERLGLPVHTSYYSLLATVAKQPTKEK